MSALADAFTESGHNCTFFKGDDEPIDYTGFDIIILDTYEINSEYIEKLNSPGRTLICYDDNALYTYDCDILMNSNLHAHELEFKLNPSGKTPKMLLGGKYALLRREFRNCTPITVRKKASCIFVCFGGSDLQNMTPRVISALQDIEGVSVNAVLGGLTKNDEEVYALAKENVAIRKTPKSMPDIITRCDIAVTSSGTMTYELAALGIPAITIAQAENQFLLTEYMSRNKLVTSAGDWLSVDFDSLKSEAMKLLGNYERRKSESAKLVETVDRNGVVNAVETIIKEIIK
jgi:spore coat polysaccharide biosynthesis predicted glycosyltransferase SpsG